MGVPFTVDTTAWTADNTSTITADLTSLPSLAAIENPDTASFAGATSSLAANLAAIEAADTFASTGIVSGAGAIIGDLVAVEDPDVVEFPEVLPIPPIPVVVPIAQAPAPGEAGGGAAARGSSTARTRSDRLTVPSILSPKEMEMLMGHLPDDEQEAIRREMDEDDVAFLLEHMDDVL